MTRHGPEPALGAAPTVLVDANVLYSQVLSDYLVHAQSAGVITVRWSPQILDEMTRTMKSKAQKMARDRGDLQRRADRIDRLRIYIETQYPDALIHPQPGHFKHFADLGMPDPDDRHVVAAAVAARAKMLCTNNVKDFPNPVLERVRIERVTPDELLQRLASEHPSEMARAHQRAVDWTYGTTHQATLEALRRANAPQTADMMTRLLAPLGNLDSRDDLASRYEHAIAERDRAQRGLAAPAAGGPETAPDVQFGTPLQRHRLRRYSRGRGHRPPGLESNGPGQPGPG
jgi:predicted nucleic acid-binding protein